VWVLRLAVRRSREALAGRDIAGLGELLEGCEYAGGRGRAGHLGADAGVSGEQYEFVIFGRIGVLIECVDERPDELKQCDRVAAKLHLQPAKCLPV
jgi:hypothetical protein